MPTDAYQILFSIPQIDSAFMRNPAGGGRIKLDIEQSSVAAINAMLDEAVRRSGVTFAAAVVIVEIEENRSNDGISEETKVKRRAARRPTRLVVR